jgi:hypothetical protein
VPDAQCWLRRRRRGIPSPGQYPDRLLQFDVYASTLLEHGVVEGRLEDGQYDFAIGDTSARLFLDDGKLFLRVGETEVVVQAAPEGSFTPSMEITVGGISSAVRLRLQSWDPSSGSFRLLRGRAAQVLSSDPAQLDDFRRLAGAIMGEGITLDYQRGRFGTTMAEGGDGVAEQIVAEWLAANHDYFVGSLLFAARRAWDLLILYIPSFDAAGHAFIGMLDEDSSAWNAETARRVWPVLERLFLSVVDSYVGEIRHRFPDATLVVTSDHGMEGVGRTVMPNVALRKAGLLALDDKGATDLSRTRAVHLPGRSGGIFINSADWLSGIVLPPHRAGVKRQVASVLLGLRDPETGASPIRAVFDSDLDGLALGFGGPAGADLYFDPAPDYSESASMSGEEAIGMLPPTGVGRHGPAPWRRKLHGILYVAGPGVEPGRSLGVVRAIDVAPTVAALLGIQPPANATGRDLLLGSDTR